MIWWILGIILFSILLIVAAKAGFLGSFLERVADAIFVFLIFWD